MNGTDYSKYPPHVAPVTPVVKKILEYKKRGTVLDLGSGGGRHAYFLARRGFTVTVLDKDRRMLENLKKVAKREGVRFTYWHADIATAKLTGTYDVIVAAVSLHFLKAKDVPRVIATMKRHTKRGGLNVITVHTKVNTHLEQKYLFSKNELRNYYRGWRIRHYRELWGKPFRMKTGSRFIRRHRAELIAEKER